MPDPTLSQAIREAYASAPVDVIVHHTLEIWHPAFTAPIRVVRDRVSLDARIEPGAPRNAGQVVTFVAYAFEIEPPEVSPDAAPSCTIEIDNVSRDILAQVDLAVQGTQAIEVLYRAYLSTDPLAGPHNVPPLALTVLSISADVFRIRARAGFPDLGNRRFPAADYSAEVFPGLVAT